MAATANTQPWNRALEITKVTVHFEANYGHDDSKLDKWQRLCNAIGVTVGSSITQCKKNLKGNYVNIFDFVDACDSDQPVRVYKSQKALQTYIRNHRRKIFPLARAKDNPILKWMLIEL